jgi:hypothetical protein
MQNFILSIDPSIRSLGYCLLDEDRHLRSAAVIAQETMGTDDYRLRAFWMAQMMAMCVRTLVDTTKEGRIHVVVEAPENWKMARGVIARDSEAVQKLYFFVGALIVQLVATGKVFSVWITEPTTWKGNLPKSVTSERARKFAASMGVVLGPEVPHDTLEAVLLGHYASHHFCAKPPSEDLHFPHPQFTLIWMQGALQGGRFTTQDFVDDEVDKKLKERLYG